MSECIDLKGSILNYKIIHRPKSFRDGLVQKLFDAAVNPTTMLIFLTVRNHAASAADGSTVRRSCNSKVEC